MAGLNAEDKMKILALVDSQKHLIFSKDSAAKEMGWKYVFDKAQAEGLVSAHTPWHFIRDSMWGNWKSRALQKAKKVADAGLHGHKESLNIVHEKIIAILQDVRPELFPKLGSSEKTSAEEEPEGVESESFATRRKKLKIQLLELEVYHKRLMCLGMERGLKVKTSIHTCDFESA